MHALHSAPVLSPLPWSTEGWHAGVEGVMRRCCEETMRVLRDNREALLILIEVLC
jgi:hypothetical protein